MEEVGFGGGMSMNMSMRERWSCGRASENVSVSHLFLSVRDDEGMEIGDCVCEELVIDEVVDLVKFHKL